MFSHFFYSCSSFLSLSFSLSRARVYSDRFFLSRSHRLAHCHSLQPVSAQLSLMFRVKLNGWWLLFSRLTSVCHYCPDRLVILSWNDCIWCGPSSSIQSIIEPMRKNSFRMHLFSHSSNQRREKISPRQGRIAHPFVQHWFPAEESIFACSSLHRVKTPNKHRHAARRRTRTDTALRHQRWACLSIEMIRVKVTALGKQTEVQ